MAVYIKPKGSDKIPEGAVVLTEERAIQYQMSILDKWPNYSEVWVFIISLNLNYEEKFSFSWALRIGPGILSGTSILSSFIINNHFRYKLKLGQYGRFSSYMSVIAIPAMISSLFHVSVSSRISAMNNNHHIFLSHSSFKLTWCCINMSAPCVFRCEQVYFKPARESCIPSFWHLSPLSCLQPDTSPTDFHHSQLKPRTF